MLRLHNSKHHARRLACLMLATAFLTSLVTHTGYASTQPPRTIHKRKGSISKQAPTPITSSKQNGKIAFVRVQDGGEQIYLMNPDGSNQTRLTEGSSYNAEPAWSPDGAKIAFSSNRDGKVCIYSMDSDGRNVIRLTNNESAFSEEQPTWSPDGTRIAFASSRNNNLDIYVMNADGGNQTRLTSDQAADGYPAWSPDGAKIAFASNRGGDYDIYLMNADGTNQVRLVGDSPGDDISPTWSPDGSQIAYATQDLEFIVIGYVDFGTFIVQVSAVDGSIVGSPAASDFTNNTSPAWSPDGKKIAYAGDTPVFRGDFQIYTTDVDGNGVAQLTNNSTVDLQPAWQPLLSAPGPNTVQFSSSSYTVSEGSPRVDITLSRSGDTTSSASVSFATNDGAGLNNCDIVNGIASPRCDYINTIGSVQFGAGETSKTFSIAIVDDSYAEGNESFTVSLNNASGSTLGTLSTATVTIIDNDSTNGVNPIDDTAFFVRQQYIDFLGREPDPLGFAGWTGTINNCTGDTTQCDRIHVSQQFFQSAEFQDRGYFVYRFYPVAFGRKPDYAEFVPDLARVSGFLDANQLESAKAAFIADFMARPGFVGQYNSLSNTAYVDALINTAAVNVSNRQALIDSLNNNTATRAQVLRQIVESSEVSTKYNHQAFAVMEYFGYLRRQPDAFYLDWITVLDSTNDPRGMVDGFVNSAEYRQRFGL
jgi:Tol biopolymer transport system component